MKTTIILDDNEKLYYSLNIDEDEYLKRQEIEQDMKETEDIDILIDYNYYMVNYWVRVHLLRTHVEGGGCSWDR